MEKINLICVSCPKGCTLDVRREGDTIVSVEAGCKRGVTYAHQELFDPRRMVASTVKVVDGLHPLVPVATSDPFPKPQIPQLLQALREVQVQAPVKIGQVIIPSVLGTDVDVIASRDMPEEQAASI
jgi:CxxC motif-containing protein